MGFQFKPKNGKSSCFIHNFLESNQIRKAFLKMHESILSILVELCAKQPLTSEGDGRWFSDFHPQHNDQARDHQGRKDRRNNADDKRHSKTLNGA